MKYGKTSTAAVASNARTRFRWNQVLVALENYPRANETVKAYRDAGFSPDDFTRLVDARVTMCELLVAAEDSMEMEYPRRRQERSALSSFRRRLEAEIWQ